jgi:hypothetical protein
MRWPVWPALAALLLGGPAGATTQAPIVNGVATADHPAVGALLTPGNPNSAFLVCSGTLIGCRTFLTAGHCVEGALDPSSYVVFLQHAGFVGVSDIAVHPSYDFPVGDVAVLTLATPVTGIRPVAIDTVGGQGAGTSGTIVGFGRTGGSSQDYGLKRKGLVSLASCGGGVSDTTSICWSFTTPVGPPGEDSNTCNGDSGGPLFTDPGSGPVTAGITSGGASATCLATDDSYDARVATYAAFINAVGGSDVGATSCSSLPQVDGPDTSVAAFAGALGGALPQATHTVTVPAGVDLLRVTMNAIDDGSDFDLYVRAGSPPSTTTYDCAANGSGQFAACEFTNPTPGTWHLLVQRFSGSGGYQATATTFASQCAEPESEGLPCDDGNACTAGEQCAGGFCTGGGPTDCNDGVACTLDACAPASGCTHAAQHTVCGPCAACDAGAGCVAGPRPDCRPPTLPEASVLKLRNSGEPAADLIVWKWTKGAATATSALGSPATTTDYHLCLFDESGGGSTLAVQVDVPAGGLCDGTPCWQATGTGFKYRNATHTPHGVTKLVLKGGDSGRAKVTTKGKGGFLPPLPSLPLALPARLQLQGEDAACFEAVFDGLGVIRNDGELFVGRGD